MKVLNFTFVIFGTGLLLSTGRPELLQFSCKETTYTTSSIWYKAFICYRIWIAGNDCITEMAPRIGVCSSFHVKLNIALRTVKCSVCILLLETASLKWRVDSQSHLSVQKPIRFHLTFSLHANKRKKTLWHLLIGIIIIQIITTTIIIKRQFIRRSNMAIVTTRAPYNVRCSYSGND